MSAFALKYTIRVPNLSCKVLREWKFYDIAIDAPSICLDAHWKSGENS